MTQKDDGRTGTERPTNERAPATTRGRRLSRRAALRLGAVGVGTLAGCTAGRRDRDGSAGPIDATADGPTATRQPVAERCETDSAVDGDGPLYAEYDARAAFRCLGEPLDNMENLARWETTSGTVAADPDRFAVGTQSAHLRADAADERAWISRPFPGGLDLSDRNPSLAVHIGDSDTAPWGVYCRLLAPDAENRITMRHTVSAGGWCRIDPGPTAVRGDPDLTDVRRIGVGAWAGDREVDFWVDALRTTDKPDRGLVVFTFDDNLASQYDAAFPVLREYDFPGVVGVIPSTVGADGRLSLGELRELQSAGWDAVNHPQVEKPLPALPAEKQRAAIERTKRWLLDEGFEEGSRFGIWPYSAAGSDTLDIASRYYSLSFGSGQTTSGVPVTDPLTVCRFDGNDVEHTKRMFEFAAEYRTLAAPMYHPVGGDDAVSAAEFREVVALADELDLAVVSASELWDDHLPSAGGG